MPCAHSPDDAEVDLLYARMPTLVKPSWVTSHGRNFPVHVKHSAPSEPKMFSCEGPPLGVAISGLMFQMNVGCLALARRSAPVNCSVATNVANALSSARLACTC